VSSSSPYSRSFILFDPIRAPLIQFLFFSIVSPITDIYTLSLHDALPIFYTFLERILIPTGLHHFIYSPFVFGPAVTPDGITKMRSEEHTSELQSRFDLVCRLLLEKKKDTEDK